MNKSFTGANLNASSMSHGKFVAAKTITILRLPSSLVPVLLAPSTCTKSSDFTLLDDSCSPEALEQTYCNLDHVQEYTFDTPQPRKNKPQLLQYIRSGGRGSHFTNFLKENYVLWSVALGWSPLL